MDHVPEGLKDVLENSRDHDSSTKVAEILQVYSEAKEAMLLPEHCLHSQDRAQTSQLDVACFAPRFALRSSPGIYPRKRDKAARSATLSTPQAPASPFVLAITRNASANDRLQPLPHAR